MNSQVERTQQYGFKYTSSPGKSYIIEPTQGELDYRIAYKDPIKFYDLVMEQEVVQHKLSDGVQKGTVEISSKITQRKIGKIMRNVQKKLTELMWMKEHGFV